MKRPKHPFRLALTALVVIGVLLSISLTANAVIQTRSYPVNVEIVTGTKEIALFIGPDYSSPVAGLNVAQLRRGGPPVVLALRVQNTGVETLNERVMVSPASVPWGTVTLSKTDFGALAPGQTSDFTMTITVPVSAPVGNVSFTLEFYEP